MSFEIVFQHKFHPFNLVLFHIIYGYKFKGHHTIISEKIKQTWVLLMPPNRYLLFMTLQNLSKLKPKRAKSKGNRKTKKLLGLYIDSLKMQDSTGAGVYHANSKTIVSTWSIRQ